MSFMKHIAARLLLLTAGLLCAATARAEMANYSYHWSITPGAAVNGPTTTGGANFALVADGTNSSTVGDLNPSVIPAAWVTTTSSAPASNPDVFTNVPFSLKLHLTDTDLSRSGDLTFTGLLNGTLTFNTSQLTAVFPDPLTRQLTLGSHLYSVTIDPTILVNGQHIVNLPVPGGDAKTLIDALITVAPAQSGSGGGTGGSHGTPEPSSLVLAALGLGLAGAARRRTVRSR
jgi:hypothetical protein